MERGWHRCWRYPTVAGWIATVALVIPLSAEAALAGGEKGQANTEPGVASDSAEPTPGRAENKGPLKNPCFDNNAEGWDRTVYGSPSTVKLDTKIVHKGKHSLRISAEEPSDTALGQEVRLEPYRCYRLGGWVRTRQLDPHGAPVFGTLQVQRPGGKGIIASGKNHQGDTDWTQVEVFFEAPPDGLAVSWSSTSVSARAREPPGSTTSSSMRSMVPTSPCASRARRFILKRSIPFSMANLSSISAIWSLVCGPRSCTTVVSRALAL